MLVPTGPFSCAVMCENPAHSSQDLIEREKVNKCPQFAHAGAHAILFPFWVTPKTRATVRLKLFMFNLSRYFLGVVGMSSDHPVPPPVTNHFHSSSRNNYSTSRGSRKPPGNPTGDGTWSGTPAKPACSGDYIKRFPLLRPLQPEGRSYMSRVISKAKFNFHATRGSLHE